MFAAVLLAGFTARAQSTNAATANATVTLDKPVEAAPEPAVKILDPTGDSKSAAYFGKPMLEPAALNVELKPESLASKDSVESSTIKASGILVAPFKADKIKDVPKRIWRWINPFGPVEKTEPEVTSSSSDLSPRAWSTTVGWQPSASKFGDPITHESSMGLIQLSKPSER